MAFVKISHGAVALVAVLFLGGAGLLPSHASTTGKLAAYNHAAPAPSPSPPAPAPPIQPVIIVQGVIYCKSCNLNGAYNRNMDASPLPNATARLVCYGGEETGYRVVLNATSTATDRNGYFLVMVYDLAVFSRRSCRVYLRSSPARLCAAPFVPANAALGLTLVREDVGRLPRGVRGVYRPRSALMYGPGRNGRCPAS